MSRHLHDVVLAINNRIPRNRCRKKEHSYVQHFTGLAESLGFIDAVARWPGATNDATIFEMSGL
ncbi:hypothetical protein MAR_011311, partial [Mya arenaria]